MQLIVLVLLWLPCAVTAVIRKRTEYENMDNDIVQGEDDRHTDDDEGEIGGGGILNQQSDAKQR